MASTPGRIEDVEAFEAFWPIGSKPRLAMSIMLYLGVRRSDACLIGKKHESRDGQYGDFPGVQGAQEGRQCADTTDLAPLSRDP